MGTADVIATLPSSALLKPGEVGEVGEVGEMGLITLSEWLCHFANIFPLRPICQIFLSIYWRTGFAQWFFASDSEQILG